VTSKRRKSSSGKAVKGVKAANPKKLGRPLAFKPEYIDRAAAMYRHGSIDEEVATSLGVALSTLYKWKAEISEFSEAVRQAREVVTDKVEAAYYNRAIGCKVPAIHFTNFEGEVIQTPFMEYYPPDPNACIGWLKANRPQKYREVTRMEHSGKVSHSANIEDMSAEELAAAKERLDKLEAQQA